MEVAKEEMGMEMVLRESLGTRALGCRRPSHLSHPIVPQDARGAGDVPRSHEEIVFS
jgi:hypothetical protein